MSELKAIKIELNNHGKPIASIQGTTSYYGISPNDTFYSQEEVDKVIADITEGAMSMFRESNRCRGLDMESPLGRIANVAFKHWNRVEYTMSNNRQLRLDKANLLRSNEYLRTRLNGEMSRRLTDKLEYTLNTNRSNRKLCLAKAQEWRNYAAFCGMQSSCHNHRGFGKTAEQWSWKQCHAWRCMEHWIALAEEPTWAKFLQLIHKEAK